MRDKITDAQRQIIIDLLPVSLSLRQIAVAMDLGNQAVSRAAKPFIAIMQATGTLPLCQCGQPRFHPRICGRTAGVGGKADTPEMLARRASVIAAIMTGETYMEIGTRFGIDSSAVRQYQRHLTPAQRDRRKAMERARRMETAPSVSRPIRDHLYRRIASYVPRWLDQHLHDDVTSEAYIALLDGTISEADLRENVERFARVARDSFASKWGHLSLNAKMFADSDATLADLIPDPAALAAFDRIFEEVL
ncbi:hypothetical protein EBBID32_1050 [Sphingobium indicum BiD32]|uniref:Uncharacterized protein n=1 Tax=Sphingobium indicum BiD32 TaxID=1301087 RepID=N1MJF3_9SPHN|nr:hypothetical protein [Sphingobium indicum]CCW15777.1 hypothetical protein EBBID32_1050 [Sphingobium indicum BiD32]